MSGINSVAFNGYTGSTRFAPKQQDPPAGAMAFRANDYPYYNEEPKKKHTGLWIAGTLLAAAGIVVGMGYAHKYNDKITNETLKKVADWAEPATKKCHEWCAWTKNTGKKCIDTVKGWFTKKD